MKPFEGTNFSLSHTKQTEFHEVSIKLKFSKSIDWFLDL